MTSSFPVQPARALLLERCAEQHLTVSELALILRLPRRTLHRVLASNTLRWDTADRIAVALGYHPYEPGPTWYDDPKENTA